MTSPIDVPLARLEVYGQLLVDTEKDGAGLQRGRDILTLVKWVKYAHPLLGAVSPAPSFSELNAMAAKRPVEQMMTRRASEAMETVTTALDAGEPVKPAG